MKAILNKCWIPLLAAAFLAGCQGQENDQTTAPISAPPSLDLAMDQAAPDPVPLPPSPGVAPAPTLAVGEAPSTGGSGGSPATDPLFYFRTDENGRALSDLAALQQAVTAYSRKAGTSDDPDVPPWPNLADLSQLVKVGLLPALPAAPAGQRYALDPKGVKVSLVNQ